jgi:AMMECR1 domain-containing protein
MELATRVDWPLAELLSLARAELNRHFTRPAQPETPLPPLPRLEFDKVNITIRAGGRLRASMSAAGPHLAASIRSAVKKCTRDCRFGPPLQPEDAGHCVIELWIQTGAKPVNANNREALVRELMLGVHGVEIRLNGNYAYFKPSVAVTSDLPGHSAVLEKLCLKAGLDQNARRKPGAGKEHSGR